MIYRICSFSMPFIIYDRCLPSFSYDNKSIKFYFCQFSIFKLALCLVADQCYFLIISYDNCFFSFYKHPLDYFAKLSLIYGLFSLIYGLFICYSMAFPRCWNKAFPLIYHYDLHRFPIIISFPFFFCNLSFPFFILFFTQLTFKNINIFFVLENIWYINLNVI